MTPSDRTMPTVRANWDEMLRSWLVSLPGNVTMSARTPHDVEALVAKHASGSAVRYYRVAPLTEAELRAAHGDR